MNGPMLLLGAMEQAVDIAGDGCTNDSRRLVRLLMRLLLSGSPAQGLDALSRTLLRPCDVELWHEVSHFAREGFTFGEIYDCLAERVMEIANT